MSEPQILCEHDEAAWSATGAALCAARLSAAVAARGRATLLLAGGSTPEPLYRALAARGELPWGAVHFFWGDERLVPPDHPESNFRMARAALLEPLGIAPDDARLHRLPSEPAPTEGAAMAEQNLRLFFGCAPGTWPRFDVALLGMGDDGHTASLFPDTVALAEAERLVVANPVPQLGSVRLTVTFPLLNAARCLIVLVRGASKAPRVAEALTGQAHHPISRVRPTQGELFWLLDQAAARALPPAQGA